MIIAEVPFVSALFRCNFISMSTRNFTYLFFVFVLFGGRCVAQTDTLTTPVKDSLMLVLFFVDNDDQKYRNQMDDVQDRFGGDSDEMKALEKRMREADSLNLIKVSSILNEYGWLGRDEIGSQCNTTLFMVIQHADLDAQVKYLPMMREAVVKGNADPGSLALLEDRVALLQGRKQIYGSQIIGNMKTNEYYVAPLEDPDNVDKRRAEVGLPPMAVYLEVFGLTWDVELYKKNLPAYEAEFFKNTN